MIARARRIADDVLFPVAQEVDRSTIPPSHFAELADSGLFSLTDLPPSEARRTIAAIGGGCGATFFVWVQHHGVLRTLMSSTNDELRDELDGPMRAGELIAGTAFAHVRRSGTPAIRATRRNGRWYLDGFAPWATSWGIARRFCVAAETDDGRIHWSMLPGDGGPGVVVTPLDLPVFAATGTVSLTFDGCPVNDDQVVAIDDVD
ncbi:MAG: acyl-CoA dehydrogenase family protein, partial [Ilumatobacter sp.]